MTVLEFGSVAMEYARTHAVNFDEIQPILDFALFLTEKYTDELFTSTSAVKKNDLPKLSTLDEKDAMLDKKIGLNRSRLVGNENTNANVDRFMNRVRRYYYYLGEYNFKTIDETLRDFAPKLVCCSASSENELQDFINSYYDSTGALRYSDLGSLMYVILHEFAHYILL